jgi:predicted nucleic acid-binding protein
MTPAKPAKGATLDTGFLIAVERRHARALALLRAFKRGQVPLTVPAVVLAEWWRGSPDQRHVRSRLPRSLTVEPVDEDLAERVGVAVARVRGASTNDALVMASAARSGDTVYTSDFEVPDRLREQHFRAVRVLAV